MKVTRPTRFLAMPLMVAGMFLSSELAVGEDPIPFDAMMQSASAPAAVPPKPDANSAAGQAVNTGKITLAGKAEIVGGYVLLGTGALTVGVTAAINSGFKYSGGKVTALYAGGAAAAGVGVTLIVLGSHRHPKK
jgi:hypothetical protein